MVFYLIQRSYFAQNIQYFKQISESSCHESGAGTSYKKFILYVYSKEVVTSPVDFIQRPLLITFGICHCCKLPARAEVM